MVKLSQTKQYKKPWGKPAVFRRAWGLKYIQRGSILRGGVPPQAGFEGAQPLATFWNLSGSGCPDMTLLALDEVQTVLYTHMVITKFLISVKGLNELHKFPKISQGRSNLVASVPSMGVAAISVVMTCPETLSISSGCWFETV